ncbi:MAG: right-handed parallel beta-helix repeat-containing protein [Bryobacterales bacterium]|nr:right-handed parallel beta-helix repeat-containing protein [Bryobacterales bacterium]
MTARSRAAWVAAVLPLLWTSAPGAGQHLPEPFDAGAVFERMLHVSTRGSASGDGTAEAPLDSIQAAVRRATPGTRILVHAGTYKGRTSLTGLRGEPGRPIAIVAAGEVVLDAAGASTILAGSDLRYVVIDGFLLRGSREHAINIDDGGSYETPTEHLVLRNLTIAGAGSGGNHDCIKLSGVDRFFVLDSEVWGCDRGELIDMVGCHHGLIAGNYFHEPVSNGVQAKGGSADILIHGNLFADIPGRAVNAGGSTGLEFFRPLDAPYEAARIRVIGNIFLRTGAAAGAAIAYVGCDGCVFAHNTVVEPRTWVARILQESAGPRFVPSRNGFFVNNIVVFRTADLRTVVNVGPGTAPETFLFGWNLWYALDQGPDWPGPSLGGGVPPESGSVHQRDPGFADFEGGDFHIPLSSPARGAGRSGIVEPLPDYDGRCWSDPPAVGAFEAGLPRKRWVPLRRKASETGRNWAPQAVWGRPRGKITEP